MSQKKAKAERKVEKEQQSKEINTQEAQAAIQKDKQERISKGSAEIELVLKKYNISLDAIMILTRRGNVPQVKVLAND